MEPSIQSDIFFTLGSIVLVIVLVLLIVFIIYVIRVLRAIQGVRGAMTKAKLGGLLFKPGVVGKGILASTIARWIISYIKRRKHRQ